MYGHQETKGFSCLARALPWHSAEMSWGGNSSTIAFSSMAFVDARVQIMTWLIQAKLYTAVDF